jgi:hypothetical protein
MNITLFLFPCWRLSRQCSIYWARLRDSQLVFGHIDETATLKKVISRSMFHSFDR